MLCAATGVLLSNESPGFLIYVLAAVLGSFMAFSLVGFTSLFGDVTEVGEYHFGHRTEGSFTGIQQFIRKCSAGLANWGALMLLGLAGFINPIPVEKLVDGITKTELVDQEQTLVVLWTIKGIFAIASMLLLIPSTIIAIRWKLTKQRHAALIGYLDRKRAGLGIDEEMEKEIEDICKPLI
jgi:Na+/melibiose symporter-like transporter